MYTTTGEDLRGPTFTSLHSKQRQHCRQYVVVAELPAAPHSLVDRRQLVSVLVLEIIAPEIIKMIETEQLYVSIFAGCQSCIACCARDGMK